MMRKFAIDQDNCAFRIADGEAILIHSETTFYYGLNEVGTQIWQMLLDGDVTAEEVASRLHGEGDPPAELLGACAAFLEELAEEQFLAGEGDAATQPSLAGAAGDAEWEAPVWMPQITKFNSLDDLIVTGE